MDPDFKSRLRVLCERNGATTRFALVNQGFTASEIGRATSLNILTPQRGGTLQFAAAPFRQRLREQLDLNPGDPVYRVVDGVLKKVAVIGQDGDQVAVAEPEEGSMVTMADEEDIASESDLEDSDLEY